MSIMPMLEIGFLVYFIALNSFYSLLLVLAIPEIWRNTRLADDDDLAPLMHSDALPPVTILVPAYNESATIVTSVTALLKLQFGLYQVVVVNDGSRDDTMDVMRRELDLYEVPRVYPEHIPTKRVRAVYGSRTHYRLWVIDKENGGKADALNAAINASRFPLVIAVDADTVVEPDALLRLTRPFLLGREIAAAGGTIRVANGCRVESGVVTDARVPRRALAGIQVVEYLRAFLFGRLGWNRLGGSLIVSGAFGLFRKDYLLQVGGYNTDSVVEDLEVVVRLHRHLRLKGVPYEVAFIPDPVAWTEVPESFRILGAQRERWHRGLLATLRRHRDMLFNPRLGRVGMIAVPFFMGEAAAPAVEVAGYLFTFGGLVLGAVNLDFAIPFLLVAWGYGMLLSIWAVALEEATFRRYGRLSDALRLALYAVTETFWYRQCTVWWRFRAFFTPKHLRLSWGSMRRRGFGEP